VPHGDAGLIQKKDLDVFGSLGGASMSAHRSSRGGLVALVVGGLAALPLGDGGSAEAAFPGANGKIVFYDTDGKPSSIGPMTVLPDLQMLVVTGQDQRAISTDELSRLVLLA
jgi:hypothetical protein